MSMQRWEEPLAKIILLQGNIVHCLKKNSFFSAEHMIIPRRWDDPALNPRNFIDLAAVDDINLGQNDISTMFFSCMEASFNVPI